jgi:hypothetical protein
MLDAPSESEAQCRSIPGKIFDFIPGNNARNVSVRSHSWIAAGVSLMPISLCHNLFIKGDQLEEDSEQYRFNSETRPGMHKQMRSWFNFRQ